MKESVVKEEKRADEKVADAPWYETVGKEIKDALTLTALSKDVSVDSIYDIAVIGGGIAGLSAARAASKAGARTVLLERAPALAAGASGKNAGILGAGVNTPLVNMPRNHPAMDMWRSTSELLPELYAIAARPENRLIAKNVGALSLSKSDTASKRLSREAKARTAAGLNAEIIRPAKIADLTFDHLDLRGVQCALFLPDEGRINPLTLLAYSAREARTNGCTLFGGAEIIERKQIQVKSAAGASQKIWQLSTACGVDILASKLIYATGPVVNANRRIYAISYRIDLPEIFPLFWDSAPFTYYDYRAGEGFLTITGGKYGNAGQITADERFHNAMIAAAQSWMPALRKMQPSHMWAVNLEVAADMMPQILEVSAKPVALSIEGLGALGVLPGMVLGKQAGLRLAERS